jgi:hypothetical protein
MNFVGVVKRSEEWDGSGMRWPVGGERGSHHGSPASLFNSRYLPGDRYRKVGGDLSFDFGDWGESTGPNRAFHVCCF